VLSGNTPAVQHVTWHANGTQGELEYTLSYELSSFPEHVANILSGRSTLEEGSRSWLEKQL